MKPIKFKGHNAVLGKGQPEYEELPAFINHASPMGEISQCWEITDDDLITIAKTRKIWVTQFTFGERLQPIRVEADSPIPEPQPGATTDPRIIGYKRDEDAIMCLSKQAFMFAIRYIGPNLTGFISELMDGCEKNTIKVIDLSTFAQFSRIKQDFKEGDTVHEIKQRLRKNTPLNRKRPPLCLTFDGQSTGNDIAALREWLTGSF